MFRNVFFKQHATCGLHGKKGHYGSITESSMEGHKGSETVTSCKCSPALSVRKSAKSSKAMKMTFLSCGCEAKVWLLVSIEVLLGRHDMSY